MSKTSQDDETFDGTALAAVFVAVVIISLIILFCLVSMVQGDMSDFKVWYDNNLGVTRNLIDNNRSEFIRLDTISEYLEYKDVSEY